MLRHMSPTIRRSPAGGARARALDGARARSGPLSAVAARYPAAVSLFPTAEGALGIRDLYRKVSLAVARGLRGQVWVRGEVSALREKNGWCFVTLAEPARDHTEADAALDVVMWRPAWSRIGNQLTARGLSLREGMTVSLRGEVVLRPGTGRIQLECSMLDTDALLGELAARRLALRRTLADEGLLEANGRRPLALVPLRVGLVASHDSQGYQDFRNVLTASGYAFVLVERPVVVQGLDAPKAVAVALGELGSKEVDLVVVVRGGGARGDLEAFDSELVARAVAGAPVPVWTGLGHTGDRCLADDAAAVSHATPTACAQALVSMVATFERAVCDRARRVQQLARRADAGAGDRLEARRRLLARSAGAQLDRHGDSTCRVAADLQISARRCAAAATGAVTAVAQRLPRSAGTVLDERTARLHHQASTVLRAAGRDLERNDDRLAGTSRVLVAFDPSRQLERGWTLTLDDRGALVRRASALRPGQRITSRFVDGERASVVEAGAPDDRGTP